MKAHRVKFLPSGGEIAVRDGSTVHEAAAALGIPIRAECGAQGRCGRCVVKVESGDAPPTPHPALPDERQARGYRLACLLRVAGDLVVSVPDESLLPAAGVDFETVILAEDDAKRRDALAGLVPSSPLRRIPLELPPPTLDDNIDDRERVCRALRAAGVRGEPRVGLSSLRRMPAVLRGSGWKAAADVFAGRHGPEIVSIRPVDAPGPWGLAVDLGTTTVVAEIVDLATGACLRRAAAYNRQLSCGADIISRIVAASREGGAGRLRELALETIHAILDRLCRHAGIGPDDISAAAVAGNTTMVHLLLGLPAEQIRIEPYIPVVNRYPVLAAAEVGLGIDPSAPVLLAPGIGSYVGGDVLAGIIACGMHRAGETILFIDAGTNGEIVLGNRDWMMGCACSTGPAFEGVGIASGMMASPGAVEAVAIPSRDAAPSIVTIAGGPARGLCGSGMIDLMAQLFLRGLVDRRGTLDPGSGCPRIADRGGHRAYLVREEGEEGAARDIHLTDVDLKKLLRTKAAIQSAIRTLLRCADLEEGEIARIVIAGRLGEAIDAANAAAIGMLPPLPLERFSYVGNGSLWGANMLLLSGEKGGEILSLADRITYIDLSTHPRYMDEFIASLFIPHTDAVGK